MELRKIKMAEDEAGEFTEARGFTYLIFPSHLILSLPILLTIL